MHACAVCSVAKVANSACAVITSDRVLTVCVGVADRRSSSTFVHVCNERHKPVTLQYMYSCTAVPELLRYLVAIDPGDLRHNTLGRTSDDSLCLSLVLKDWPSAWLTGKSFYCI